MLSDNETLTPFDWRNGDRQLIRTRLRMTLERDAIRRRDLLSRRLQSQTVAHFHSVIECPYHRVFVLRFSCFVVGADYRFQGRVVRLL